MKFQHLRILAAVMAVLFLLCSCEEYKPAVDRPQNHPSESGADSGEGESEATGYTFTAALVDENGEAFVPTEEQPIKVKWTDGYSVYESNLDANGTATVDGLDGDYTVTIDPIPDGYAYNPNIYYATNDDRAVTIQLHKLIPTTGRGDQKYQSIVISELGVYCVELTAETQEVFYQFSPTINGEYVVESWADVTADLVNPYAKYYGANVSYKEYRFTQDDGGVSGTYTRNFLLDFAIANENISENGASVFTFGVMAGQKAGEYPVKVYFQVRRNNDYALENNPDVLMSRQEELVKQPDYPGYTFVGAESESVAFDGRKVLDGSRFKLWEKSEGGDGYYHLYDAETDTYGPILYAQIAAPCRFVPDALTRIEYAGNKVLTVSNGTENYKLFIEGFAYLNFETLSQDPQFGKPPYFCTLDCPCRINNTCDSVEVLGVVGACYDTCEDEHCKENCRRIDSTRPELMGMEGYGEYSEADGAYKYCNSDGCYAVTAELKEFLQKYSVSNRYFWDGLGVVETHDTIPVYADDDDQWLFACGYYVLNP